MIYRETALPAAAGRAAFCAWEFVMEPADPSLVQHSIPPDGTTNLVLVRAPAGDFHAMIVGPSLASDQVPVMQDWRYGGIRLRPEAAARVIGKATRIGGRDTVERGGALEPVWADLERLLSGAPDWRATVALLCAVGPTDATVRAAVDWLVETGGTMPLATLARSRGLSERHFRRRFRAATGLAPKFYADVQRVRRALIMALDDADWAGVAAEAGFADQSHLARDIRERFNAAPRRVRGYFRGMRHELLAPPDVRFVQDRAAAAA